MINLDTHVWSPPVKVLTRIAAATCSLALVGALSACGSSDSGGSDGGAVDCDAANTAIIGYADALTKIVQGLTENDNDTARSGADALPTAALTVLRSLPGLPQEAEAFLTTSEDASRVVNDSLSAGNSSEETLEELNGIFGSPDFSVAGDAVDDYFREQCPSLTPGQPQQD